MGNTRTMSKPMSIYDQIMYVFSAAGNKIALGALGFQTLGFTLNPTLLTGLLPIITGIILFIFSIYQKRQAEKRADEAHQKAIRRADEMHREELENQRLQNQILEAQLEKIKTA